METEKKEETPLQPPLLDELYYPSESDEPIEFVEFDVSASVPLTADSLRVLVNATPDVSIEESSEDRFWEPVATDQDWYGEEEKAITRRFCQLQAWVAANLSDRQLFRVGETEVNVYLLGRDTKGNWAGLKTMVVET